MTEHVALARGGHRVGRIRCVSDPHHRFQSVLARLAGLPFSPEPTSPHRISHLDSTSPISRSSPALHRHFRAVHYSQSRLSLVRVGVSSGLSVRMEKESQGGVIRDRLEGSLKNSKVSLTPWGNRCAHRSSCTFIVSSGAISLANRRTFEMARGGHSGQYLSLSSGAGALASSSGFVRGELF